MINKVYRLIAPKQIRIDFEEKSLFGNGVVVKPMAMSICVADKRYFYGMREKNILRKKLPMALIHEAVGEVVFDPSGDFSVGDKVVMIPNTPSELQLAESLIKENYIEGVKFRASGYDGFMQEYVTMRKDRLVKYEGIREEVASLTEMLSVAMCAVSSFEAQMSNHKSVFGVWGDGNLGFMISLILKNKYPESKVYVFGKNRDKLNFFSFVDEVYEIDEIPKDLKIDHAFEAVGGKGSQFALTQIMEKCNPQGIISLLGVTETPIEINTRMILEKGFVFVGTSRSGREDFLSAVDFISSNKKVQNQLSKLVTAVVDVRNVDDIVKSFEVDAMSKFKTILLWNI